MNWRTICQLYRGQWVALNAPRYHPVTGQPIEGDVVDADVDLATLCARLRASDRTACAIVFCEVEALRARAAVRPREQPTAMS